MACALLLPCLAPNNASSQTGPMLQTMPIAEPPCGLNPDGNERRIGVELEFASVSARASAELVVKLFGGRVREEDPHRFHICETSLGEFVSELDTQYAHRPKMGLGASSPAQTAHVEDEVSLLGPFEGELRRIYGDISSVIVPCEIVCPPIALSKISEIDRLASALVESGAEGTASSVFYAFGAQLNLEIASGDAAWLTAVLKSYLLASDWLRAVIAIDATRQISGFIEPFPASYIRKVVDPDYWPTRQQLISDYLEDNPTRNRELDLLPLFAQIAPRQVQEAVQDARINARPTFHYRLPNADFGRPGWNIVREWNRWCAVERLANNRQALDAACRAYLENQRRMLPGNWPIMVSEWLVLA